MISGRPSLQFGTQAGDRSAAGAQQRQRQAEQSLIEQLSLGVYDSVRRLLGRLRPRQLDDPDA